jgi:hypothetical protein
MWFTEQGRFSLFGRIDLNKVKVKATAINIIERLNHSYLSAFTGFMRDALLE